MTEAKQRVIFSNKLIQAIKEDHNSRTNLGLEPKKFSAVKYQEAILKAYPEVDTDLLFTTIKRYGDYVASGKPGKRDISPEKIRAILSYVFERHGNKAWPKTTALVENSGVAQYAAYSKRKVGVDVHDQIIAAAQRSIAGELAKIKAAVNGKNQTIEELNSELGALRSDAGALKKELKNLLGRIKADPNASSSQLGQVSRMEKLLD